MARYLGDITLSDEHGVIAAVAVKSVIDLDMPLAQAFVEDRGFAGRAGDPDFVMVVSQDRGFLWHLHGAERLADARVWDLDMAGLLAPYTRHIRRRVRLQHPELKLLVTAWVGDLADPGFELDPTLAAPLIESGFLDAVREPGVTSVAVVA